MSNFGIQWMNSYQITYTYDANDNLLTELDQKWNMTSWENFKKSTYGYDANNNQTSEFAQEWNGSSWINSANILQIYNSENMQTGFVLRFWNNDGTKVIEGDSTLLYFHAITGIPGLADVSVSIYPNPAKGKFTIGSNSAITAIEVYNLPGKRLLSDFNVKQQTLKEIDLSGYAKGIYILKIYSGTKYYTRKVIVQ